jgi:hypothetical protein
MLFAGRNWSQATDYQKGQPRHPLTQHSPPTFPGGGCCSSDDGFSLDRPASCASSSTGPPATSDAVYMYLARASSTANPPPRSSPRASPSSSPPGPQPPCWDLETTDGTTRPSPRSTPARAAERSAPPASRKSERSPPVPRSDRPADPIATLLRYPERSGATHQPHSHLVSQGKPK